MPSNPTEDRVCLVVGGLGFLGSRMASALAAAGHSVRILDRECDEATRRKVAEWGVELITGDLANAADVRRAVVGAHAVIHCAYATVPRTAAADPGLDVSANVLVLIDLLEALKDSGACDRIVYLSSGGTVYGPDAEIPIREDQPTNPISAYGVSKLACEKYVQLYGRRCGIDTLILRLSNPYGPGQNVGIPQGVVGHFLSRIAAGETLEVWGDGSVVRDYFFADDLRTLAPRLLSSRDATGVFNIGSGRGRSLLEVIEAIRGVVDTPVHVTHVPSQAYDAPANVLAVDKARDVLGWSASTAFEDGIRRTWDRLSRAVMESR